MNKYTYNIQHGKGLVIIMHGLGGSKDQPLIEKLGECFTANTVVAFDSKFTLTKNYNGMTQANYSNYCKDLEEFISFAKTQSWFEEPFTLVGHSLGGFACVKFAQAHPESVTALVLAAPAVDGQLRLGTYSKEQIAHFEQTTVLPFEAFYGKVDIPWQQFREDLEQQTVLDKIIDTPVLLLIGENDSIVPKTFHDKLQKQFTHCTATTITNSRHGFSTNYTELQIQIKQWIASQNKFTH